MKCLDHPIERIGSCIPCTDTTLGPTLFAFLCFVALVCVWGETLGLGDDWNLESPCGSGVLSWCHARVHKCFCSLVGQMPNWSRPISSSLLTKGEKSQIAGPENPK